MNKKDKQLLILGTSFLHMFLAETKEPSKHKDINKLLCSVAKLSVKYKSKLDELLRDAYEKIEEITKGEELEINTLIFGIGSLFLLAERDNGIPEPIKIKIYKLGIKIYTETEKNEKMTDCFRNANKIISEF